MVARSYLALGFLSHLITAHVLDARQNVACNFETAANNGDTCQSFAADWGLTLAGFQALNPGVSCPNLVAGQSYCVIGTVQTGAPTTTKTTTTPAPPTTTKPTTTTTPKTTTTSTTTSSPYSPTMPGLAANCNKFYRVQSGDTCSAIETKYGISASQFSSWNTAVDAKCDNLWLDYFVCVGVPGATTTSATPTPTPTGPQPQMPGIVSNCKKFKLVQSGDSCYAIDNAAGISLQQFLSWNPSVDSNCTNLWLGYYVCVGV